MAYNGYLSSPCKLDNGFVFDSKCSWDCSYMCWDSYRKPSSSEKVWCNRSTGKWMTSLYEEPCVLDKVYTPTTKTMIDLDKWKVPTWKVPTWKVPTWKIPTIKYPDDGLNGYYSDSDHQSGHIYSNSATSYGLTAAGVVAFMMLAIGFRICYAHSVSRRRQQRVEVLAERLNNIQRSSQHRSTGAPSSTNNEQENHGGRLTILRIRRFMCIPILGRGYSQLGNPPEPPPYDAESTPPPPYVEGIDEPASETSPENNCSQTSAIPEDPPPPYTANIV